MSTPTMEKPVGYILLAEPEAFQDTETGEIHETYRLDGTNIGFVIDEAGDDVRFEEITLHLYKQADGALTHVYLDIFNVPGEVFNVIGPITGLPTGGDTVKDEEFVNLRFELLPDALDVVDEALDSGTAPNLGAFFELAMPDGRSVFWDFHNYFTESIMEN